MTANYAGAKKPVPPKCEKCGAGNPHPYRMNAETSDGLQSAWGYTWLCGACRYLLDHPDAEPAKPPPRERRVPLQTERLFELP